MALAVAVTAISPGRENATRSAFFPEGYPY